MSPSSRISITAVEPVFFIGRKRSDPLHPNPILIRCLLSMELVKPTRIVAIEVSLMEKWHTEWPAGLPPTYQKYNDDHITSSTQNVMHSDKMIQALRAATPPRTPAASTFDAHSTEFPIGLSSKKPTIISKPWMFFKRGTSSSVPPSPAQSRSGSPTSDTMPLTNDPPPSSTSTSTPQWTEFPAGSYTCPVVFSIDSDAPPSISTPRGSCTYALKAQVVRHGKLSINLRSETQEVMVVILPDEDAIYSAGNNNTSAGGVEERRWDEWALMAVGFGERQYVIGEGIPMKITVVPLEKMGVFKISVSLSQKVTYRSIDGSYQTDVDRSRFSLLSIRQSSKSVPLLPIFPSSPPDTLNRLWAHEASSSHGENTSDKEYIQQLQSLEGPWSFHFDIPFSKDLQEKGNGGLHFTYDRVPDAPVTIEHEMHVKITVGGLTQLDDAWVSKGVYQDLTIDVPVQILSSHCTPAWTKLPTYFDIEQPDLTDPYAFVLKTGTDSFFTSRADRKGQTKSAPSSRHPSRSSSPAHSHPLPRPSEYPIASSSSSSSLLRAPPAARLASHSRFHGSGSRQATVPGHVSSLMMGSLNLGPSSSSSNTSAVHHPPSFLPSTSFSNRTAYIDEEPIPRTSRETMLRAERGRKSDGGDGEDDRTHERSVSNGNDADLEGIRTFARLIGGREGVDGELPPRYSHLLSEE